MAHEHSSHELVMAPPRRYLTESAGRRLVEISTDPDEHVRAALTHCQDGYDTTAIITSRQLDRLDRRRLVSFQRQGDDIILTGYEGGYVIPLDSDSTEPWMTALARRAVELAKEA
jgi:hypothetical protein